MTKIKQVLVVVTIFMVGLMLIGGSYAYWTWTSNTNKNVVFNVASNLKKYIKYDSGNSKFVGEFQVGSDYTDGVHSTISLYKTSEANKANVLANINLDINDIGSNMASSTGIKWTVTEGTSSNVVRVIASGSFNSKSAGDTVYMVSNLEVTTTETFYTIWIWADESIINSNSLLGETIDTTIWTEVNQLESLSGVFEITNAKANYQLVSATAISGGSKITNYGITTSNNEPSTWEDVTSSANIYHLEYTASSTGTYYLWFKNNKNQVVSTSVNVTSIDSTKPSCTFGNFENNLIGTGDLTSITLTCIDNETGVLDYTLSTSDLTVSNNHISVTNIIKEQVTNGYMYTITVSGTSTGSDSLVLLANKITNGVSLKNDSVTSGNITVKNTVDISSATVTLSSNSYTYDGSPKTPTVTVTVSGNTLTLNTDYQVTYTNNTDVGTATVTISGIGDYSGTVNKTFTISYNTFNITLNKNGGSGGTTTLYMRYADGVYLDSSYQNKMSTSSNNVTIPTKTNSTFDGYYDGDLQMINPSGYITNNFTDTKYSSAKTLTAHWITLADTPTVSIKYVSDNTVYTAGSWTNQSIYAELSTSSPDYAITKFQYSIDNGTNWVDLTCGKSSGIQNNSDTYSCQEVWTINGNSSVIFRAVDSASHNTGSTSAINIKYDNVSPTGSVTATYSNDSISASVTVNDVTSGVASAYGWSVSTSNTCDNTVTFTSSNNATYTYVVQNPDTYYVCVRISDNAGNMAYVSEEVDATGEKVGTPVLTDNLIPVTIANDGTVTAVSKDDNNWFDYENKLWANAVLTTSTNRSTYMAIANGNSSSTIIPESEILAYYVWIPRYKYALTSADGNPESIDIVFEKASTTKSTGTATGTSYYTHPAFTFGSDELEGFWAGKFEVSYTANGSTYSSTNMNCSNYTCANAQNLRILPNKIACGNNSIASFHYGIASMDTTSNIYGLAADGSIDLHMIKNSEWGAIAYLSHSGFGKNAEVRINNNGTYTTGCGASADNGAQNNACQIQYGNETSYPQSTTGNISGVFDMSGGIGEYVMANFEGVVGDSGFSTFPDSKYYNVYTASAVTDCTAAECNGHAMKETLGWYNDTRDYFTTSARWFIRGGDRANGTNGAAGVFFYQAKDGKSSQYRGSRAIMAVLAEPAVYDITLDNANATTNGTAKIYLKYNNGVYLDNAYQNLMTTSSNSITIPVRTNYTFNGYYDGNIQMISPTGYITSAFTNTVFSQNKTLTASWIEPIAAPTYSVKYVSDNSTYTAGDWTNQSVYTDLSITSSVTITKFQYSLNSGTTWTNLSCAKSGGIVSNGTTYSCQTVWNTNGNNNIIFRAVDSNDSNGNSSQSVNLKYDNVLPTGSITTSSIGMMVTAVVDANDTVSGIKNSYYFKVLETDTCGVGTEGTTGFIDNADNNEYSFNVEDSNDYYICAKISDNANNVAYVVRQISLSVKAYLKLIDGATEYKQSEYASYIKKIEVVNYINLTNSVANWNLTNDNTNTIKGWIINNSQNDSNYDLYIGSDYRIYGENLTSLFYSQSSSLNSVEVVDLSSLFTNETTDMSNMFYNVGRNATNFTLNFGNHFNTSNVTNMAMMFAHVGSNITNWNLNLSSFNTSNVRDMSGMFLSTGAYATTYSLNLGDNFNTSKVANMDRMFSWSGYNTTIWNLNLSSFNTSNVTNMNRMFSYAGGRVTNWNLNLSSFNTSNVTNMGGMFRDSGFNATIWNLNLSSFNTSNVTNMQGMFTFAGYNATTWDLNLGNNFDASNVTNMSDMFYDTGAGKLMTDFTLLLPNSFTITKPFNMANMFYNTGYNAKNFSLKLGNNFNAVTGKMPNMFKGIGANSTNFELDLGNNFNASKVDNMYDIFYEAGRNATVFSLNLGNNFGGSYVNNMNWMFYSAGERATDFHFDLGNHFNTLNATTMEHMFTNVGRNSTNFSLNLGNDFNVSNVRYMGSMFRGVGQNATDFNLNLRVGDVFYIYITTTMSWMFADAGQNATNFSLDLGNRFFTSKVVAMDHMFENVGYSAVSFSLNLGNYFNVSNVTNMTNAFANTARVTQTPFTLVFNGNFNKVTLYNDMFTGFGNNMATIYVANNAVRTWLTSKNSDWGTNFSASNVLLK